MKRYIISFTFDENLVDYIKEHQIDVIKRMQTLKTIAVQFENSRFVEEIAKLPGVFHISEEKTHKLP